MASEKPLEGQRILLLEDELFISAALREYLTIAGAENVETASSVSEAATYVDENHYDAAILDIMLPDGETRPLAERLATEGVRIVIHSGQLRPGWMDALPGAQFLQKPSEPDLLIATVAGASKAD